MPHSNDQIEEQIRQDWRGALTCPSARRILGRIIRNVAFSRSHYPGDALATAFNEGFRAAGLDLIQHIELAMPGETAILLAETAQEINHAD